MKVFINPGHDLRLDPGAIGNGLKEADINHEVCRLLSDFLEAAGVDVVGNVQDDSLSYVCKLANSSGADIFVSVHCNAHDNINANGTETFCYSLNSNAEKLAECIQTELLEALGTVDRGVKTADFYVLRKTVMPAVLVELAFITNPDDAFLLKTKQIEIATAIKTGICNYWRL